MASTTLRYVLAGLILIAGLGLVLGFCGSNGSPDPKPSSTSTRPPGGTSGGGSSGGGSTGGGTPSPTASPTEPTPSPTASESGGTAGTAGAADAGVTGG